MVGLGLLAATSAAVSGTWATPVVPAATVNAHIPTALRWAYPFGPPVTLPPAPIAKRFMIPGSRLSFTEAEIEDHAKPVDWQPASHPPAPAIVANVTNPKIFACGGCHLLNGNGTRGATNLSGLSADYIIEQVAEMRAGRRRSSAPERPGVKLMYQDARLIAPSEIAKAARYYAAQRFRPWVKVVETPSVPLTRQHLFGWFVVVAGNRLEPMSTRRPAGAREPIDGRIITVATDAYRSSVYDPDSGVTAYVPPGSVARGRALVMAGGGLTLGCVICHGEDLRGIDPAPPLAGRTPDYIARQLWDIKSGARRGGAVALMQAPVKRLTPADLTAVSAYIASLRP